MSLFPISVIRGKERGAAMERQSTLDSALSIEDVSASDAEAVKNVKNVRTEAADNEIAMTPRPGEYTGDCDWSEHAAPDTHLWQPSSSGVEVMFLSDSWMSLD